MKKLLPLLLAIVACAVITAFVKENTIRLELNLDKGATYLIRVTNNQNVSTQVAGQSMENKTNIAAGMDWKVSQKYGKDSTLIEAAYNNFTMDIVAADRQMHYDSEENTANAGKYLSDLVKLTQAHPIILKTNAQGDILDIRGSEALRQAAKDSLKNAPPAVQQMLDRLLTSDALKSTFSIVSIFPKKPVAIGDSWEREQQVDNVTSLAIHQKLTLKSFDAKTAVLSVNSQIESTKDSITFNGMTLPSHVTGTQSGEYTVERASGLVTDGVVNQKLTMQITFMGQSMVVHTTGESHFAESRKN